MIADGVKAYLCTVDGQVIIVIAKTLHEALDMLRSEPSDPGEPAGETLLDLLEQIAHVSDEVML